MERVKLFKQGRKATVTAAGFTIVFAIAKGIVGFISGSVVLMADAIHSSADSFSAFFAWLGLKIAQKKPTEKFPYGFYKAENIAALLISFLILFAGYEIIKESINKLSFSYQLNIPLIAIGVALVDAIVMFFVGSYEVKVGKRINSQSLIADGRESKMHIFSSIIVLIGLGSAWLNIPYLEGLMGILISVFIFKIAVESAKDSIFALMDVSPDKEIEKKITAILKRISGLEDFQDLKLRKSGPFIFGEVRARVKKKLSVKEAHKVSASIEAKIKRKIKKVDSFTISIEPYESNIHRLCIPIKKDKEVDSEISEHFGRANGFLFLLIKDGTIKKQEFKKNPFREKKVRAGLGVVEWMMKEKIDVVIIKQMGPISLHTLSDNLVEVYLTKQNGVEEVVQDFIQGNLEELKAPTRKKR